MVIQITNNNFKKLLNTKTPMMVDFWAEWCSPCRMLFPIIEELALEYNGKVLIGKINVDQNDELSTEYKILSIPTLLFFKNGLLFDTHIGGTTKSLLETKLKTLLDLSFDKK